MNARAPTAPLDLPPGTTLRQAIAAHHARLGPATVVEDDPAVAALFSAHDAVHAVFGTRTDLRGEGLTDAWTLLGTTMPLRRYLAYLRHPAVTALVRAVPWPQLLWTTVTAGPLVARVFWRARRMTRRWDFDAWRDHLDQPVEQIRADHGIVPIR